MSREHGGKQSVRNYGGIVRIGNGQEQVTTLLREQTHMLQSLIEYQAEHIHAASPCSLYRTAFLYLPHSLPHTVLVSSRASAESEALQPMGQNDSRMSLQNDSRPYTQLRVSYKCVCGFPVPFPLKVPFPVCMMFRLPIHKYVCMAVE